MSADVIDLAERREQRNARRLGAFVAALVVIGLACWYFNREKETSQ